MNTLISLFSQTPWWVYALFVVLIGLGIRALQPRAASIVTLAILPLLFLASSAYTLMGYFQLTNENAIVMGGALLFGALIGWLFVSGMDYKVDRAHLRILLPGTWIILILILVVFASKYYFAYTVSTNPIIIRDNYFQFEMLGTSGFLTGLFVGRFLGYLFALLTGESVDLSKF